MQRLSKKIFKFFIAMLVLGSFRFAFAETLLPDMMVGQTTAIDQTGSVSYGGMTGNYAIYNYDINSSYGFRLLNLQLGSTTPNNCLNQANPLCFLLGTGVDGNGNAGNDKLMVSRTRIDIGNGEGQKVAYELPVLFFGGVAISGDSFNADLGNFSFWGRNLAQSSEVGGIPAGAGISWGFDGYTVSPDSRISWNSEQTSQFLDKIGVMRDEATPLASLANPWGLQSKSFTGSTFDDEASYPQGKAWMHDGDLVIDSDANYFGLGTIIVKGNLTIAGKSINKQITAGHKSGLGFIVYGDIYIQPGTKVQASMIALPSISDPGNGGNYAGNSAGAAINNAEMIGSFVAAKNFNLGANVSMIYDQNFDDNQPPGFKYMSNATASETGNKD